MALEQSWNKRSKKWVLIDTETKGGIKDMQAEKFKGVPVRKGKPEDPKQNEPKDPEQPKDPEKQKAGNDGKDKKKKSKNWLFGSFLGR